MTVNIISIKKEVSEENNKIFKVNIYSINKILLHFYYFFLIIFSIIVSNH